MALANLLAMPPRRQPAAPTGMTPSRQVLAQRVPRSEALVRALMEGGTKSEPIETGLELIGKLAQVWGSERGQRKRDEYDREQTGRAASDMAAALSGFGSFPTAADVEAQRPTGDQTSFAPSGGGGDYRSAIAAIESGGRYDAVGPTDPELGRPLGKYQIMEANIAPWSQEVLGYAVTPEQFLSSPEIQDAIFDGKFGSYVSQFGPEGAAQAWFGGPGSVGRTDRQDVLGTSVGEYGQRFMSGLGGSGAPSGGYMFQEPPRDSTGGAVYPQPTGGPNTQGIMAALASPYLPEVYQQVGSQLLSQAMTPPDPTADLQEINGQLVNVRTGEVVGDYRDQPAAADYDSANDANGVRRYIEGPNMGQPVPGFDGPRTPTPMNPTDLRKEIQGLDSYNQWSASASVYNSMVEAAGRNSRASDLNLVYGLAKIFDPTSVVRESEQVMVQNTAAVPDYIIGIINRWNGDRALQPGTRQAIMEEAYSRVHAYEGQFERDLNQYRGIVERNALNPADILPNISPVMPWVPTEAPTTTSDPRVPPGANYLMQPDALGPQQGFVPRAPAATALPTTQTVPPPPAAAPAPPQAAPTEVWELDPATGLLRRVQ